MSSIEWKYHALCLMDNEVVWLQWLVKHFKVSIDTTIFDGYC